MLYIIIEYDYIIQHPWDVEFSTMVAQVDVRISMMKQIFLTSHRQRLTVIQWQDKNLSFCGKLHPSHSLSASFVLDLIITIRHLDRSNQILSHICV